VESILFRWLDANQPDASDNIDTPANTVQWISISADGRPAMTSKEGSLTDLASQVNSGAHRKQLNMALSSAHYSLHNAVLPPNLSMANAKKATPFALEDNLVESLDNYHFAYGNLEKNTDNTLLNVATINKTVLQQLLADLSSYDIKPKHIYAESLLLPQNSEENNIYIEEDELTAKLSKGEIYTLPIDLLDKCLDKIEDDENINIHTADASSIETLSINKENVSVKSIDTSLLSIFAKNLKDHKPLNILQGEFQPSAEIGKHIKPWKWAALFACIAVALSYASKSIDLKNLEAQNLALEDQKIEIFKKTFPKTRKFHQLKKRMSTALGKSDGGSEKGQFIPLLSYYITAADNQAISINNIDYNKNSISLNLSVADIQVLDKVKIAIENNNNVTASIISSKAKDSGLEAVLKIGSKT